MPIQRMPSTLTSPRQTEEFARKSKILHQSQPIENTVVSPRKNPAQNRL
jgi:hypothetical protein